MKNTYKVNEEAVKKIAERVYDNGSTVINRNDLEEMSPELKESEDERMKNAAIRACKYMIDNFENSTKDYEDAIAYLEKQGEHAKFLSKIQVGDKVTRNEDGVLVNLSQLNRVAKKQGEHKPAERDILSAKKGDMLSDGTIVLIVDSIGEFEGKPIINSWYFADSEKFYGKGTSECDRWDVDGLRTATEVECNYLLKMMADAGYEWDAEKKELKEIERKPADKKGMNLVEEEMTPFQKEVFCIIDTTIEEEQGLKQVCDKLFALASNEIKQKPAWSEEDMEMIGNIRRIIEQYAFYNSAVDVNGELCEKEYIDADSWLKNLKDRVQLQPQQEWSEDDETVVNSIISFCDFKVNIEQHNEGVKEVSKKVLSWLNELKSRVQPQSQWKPSDEQMDALNDVISSRDIKYDVLSELWKDLEKLKGLSYESKRST